MREWFHRGGPVSAIRTSRLLAALGGAALAAGSLGPVAPRLGGCAFGARRRPRRIGLRGRHRGRAAGDRPGCGRPARARRPRRAARRDVPPAGPTRRRPRRHARSRTATSTPVLSGVGLTAARRASARSSRSPTAPPSTVRGLELTAYRTAKLDVMPIGIYVHGHDRSISIDRQPRARPRQQQPARSAASTSTPTASRSTATTRTRPITA